MLGARVASAVVVAPLLLAAVWLGGPALWLVAVIASVIAADESTDLLTAPPHKAKRWPQRLGAIGLVAAAAVSVSALVAALAVCLVAFLLWSMQSSETEPVADLSWSSRLGAVLYAALPIALLILLRAQSGPEVMLRVATIGTIRLPRGVAWTTLILTTTWAVDSAAYVVGRSIGRHAFSRRISPKKTWEGTIGGVVAGALVFAAWAPPFQWSVPIALVVGFVVAWAAIFGDLVESSLKRRAGLKDSGVALPGHGGLLDRMDSLAFSAAVVFLVGAIDESTHVLSFGLT